MRSQSAPLSSLPRSLGMAPRCPGLSAAPPALVSFTKVRVPSAPSWRPLIKEGVKEVCSQY